MRTIIFALLLTACGTEEDTPPMNAMCKTLHDGSVHRVEVDPEAVEFRETLVEMGFEPCY
jgi:hypothetical protein